MYRRVIARKTWSQNTRRAQRKLSRIINLVLSIFSSFSGLRYSQNRRRHLGRQRRLGSASKIASSPNSETGELFGSRLGNFSQQRDGEFPDSILLPRLQSHIAVGRVFA